MSLQLIAKFHLHIALATLADVSNAGYCITSTRPQQSRLENKYIIYPRHDSLSKVWNLSQLWKANDPSIYQLCLQQFAPSVVSNFFQKHRIINNPFFHKWRQIYLCRIWVHHQNQRFSLPSFWTRAWAHSQEISLSMCPSDQLRLDPFLVQLQYGQHVPQPTRSIRLSNISTIWNLKTFLQHIWKVPD